MTVLNATFPAIAKLESATAKDNSRYAMNGARIVHRPELRPMAEVTDGKMMAAVLGDGDILDADATPSSVIAPIAALKRRDKKGLRLEINGSVKNLADKTQHDPIEGNFPPCRDVVPRDLPDADSTAVLHLNANLLARLADAIGSDGGDVTLIFDKSRLNKPIRVLPLGPCTAEALGVLMPVNGGSLSQTCTAWNERVEQLYPSRARSK